ncbi:CatB-related O-acetyltransferase [Ferrimonas gelatinilytica]|uniref:Chloramphenicol acetyltransferase n=1 Tax=Ferrimonas gelatinilytica TaxID=1255257 RepID=A0ABP9RSQ1_9GAMM
MEALLKNIAKSFVVFLYKMYLRLVTRRVNIGKGTIITPDSKLSGNNLINDGCRVISSKIGAYSYVSPNSILVNCTVGRYTSIGPSCAIGLGEHPTEGPSLSPYLYNESLFKGKREEDFSEVVIGHDCWVGANVCIKGGVRVGNSAIVGAGAVVTKDVPDFGIVVGVPAKLIRYRLPKERIQEISSLDWWLKDLDDAKRILRQ